MPDPDDLDAMPGGSFEQRMQMMLAEHRRLIADHGWSCTGVFGVRDDPSIPFLYTHGFTELGHPELVIYGIHHETAHGIMHTAYEHIVNGLPFEEGQVRDDVLIGLPVAVVRPKAHEANVARTLYGHDVPVLQIVWPDREGRFPWDEGYEYELGRQGEVAW